MNLTDPMISDGNTLLADLPAEQYHAHEALSASGAKKILRSPAHFKVWRTEKREPTADMRLGTACHSAILEPETFEDQVLCSPKFDRRTKDGKAAAEAFEAQAAGRLVLSADDFDACLRVRDAVAKHAGAQRLLADTRREVSLFWRDGQYGIPCKARLDAMRSDGGIVDLKTTGDASPDAFGRGIASWQYHLQAAFYFIGAEHVLGKTPAFFAFIAAEKEPPFAVGCYVLETAHLLAGQRLAEEAIVRYQAAVETGEWPAYGELIQPARVPAWALRFDNPL